MGTTENLVSIGPQLALYYLRQYAHAKRKEDATAMQHIQRMIETLLTSDFADNLSEELSTALEMVLKSNT